LCVLSSLCLRRSRQWQCAIIFFFGVVGTKKATSTSYRHFLLCV
jgi:hypothetical protein